METRSDAASRSWGGMVSEQTATLIATRIPLPALKAHDYAAMIVLVVTEEDAAVVLASVGNKGGLCAKEPRHAPRANATTLFARTRRFGSPWPT
jgi:hypothetical protein